ncbi:MAG: hypothetical protein ACKOQX_07830 [Actinomycetota bacterium]
MFNLTGSEIMFLLIIGLVVLGPEKLPDAIRRVGRLYAELKRMSSGVQTDLRTVMDEPLKEMMNTTNSVKSLFTETAGQFESAAKDTFQPDFVPYEPPAEAKPVELPIVLYNADDPENQTEGDATSESPVVERATVEPETRLSDDESSANNALDDIS